MSAPFLAIELRAAGNSTTLRFSTTHVDRYKFEATCDKFPGIVGAGRTRKLACVDACNKYFDTLSVQS